VPRRKEIDPNEVVWLSPETLGQAGLAERLSGVSDPDEIREILNARPTQGQYRLHHGHEVADGPDGTTALSPAYGDLVVWVNDSSDDLEDTAGHFESYHGDGADYRPQIKAGE
jgi:hypothetical protein